MSQPVPLALVGAAQVLRQVTQGLERLGQDRAEDELMLEPGDVVTVDDRIAGFERDPSSAQIPCEGCAIVPGLVDCHTHLPFVGWRAEEYALKVAGASYAEVARAGGGIRSSARALAAASDEQVLAQSRELAAEMLAHGTTTLETKSGYGLSVQGEMRALRLADELAHRVAQRTSSTALLAHAVPDGFTTSSWMDEVEGLVGQVVSQTRAGALDIFVESIAFDNDDLERLGRLARRHGLALRAHVEQLSTQGSVPVALAAGARSVDHLSRMPVEHVAALAGAECAAVLLPGAEFLGDEHVPPARELADGGATCVLATDANPGTSPVLSLPLVVGLAVRRYRWTVLEALLAVTLNAAWVLNRSSEVGSLEAGKRADLVLLDAPVEHIPYRLGHNPVAAVIVGGRVSWVRPDHAWRFESVPAEGRNPVSLGSASA
jgi:imidazolonepropionase